MFVAIHVYRKVVWYPDTYWISQLAQQTLLDHSRTYLTRRHQSISELNDLEFANYSHIFLVYDDMFLVAFGSVRINQSNINHPGHSFLIDSYRLQTSLSGVNVENTISI